MFRQSRIRLVIILAAVALLPLLSFAAAAPASAGIGVVDFQGIAENYQGYKTAGTYLQSLYAKQMAPFDILQTGIGLSEADLATYQKLKAQPVQDKEQIDKLEAQAKAIVDEFRELDSKERSGEKLTDDQKARYEALKKQILPVSAKMNQMNEQIQDTMNKETKRVRDILIAAIDGAVAKIAKEQKLTMILNKDVQIDNGTSKIVLWNDQSVDITSKVVKNLNDGFKPDMFDPAKK